MALPGNKDFNEYDNYVTDPNPTTSAQAQDYFRNQAELLKAVIDCDFWQPETVYQPGDVVKSDSMPNGTEAVMVATKASVTSNVEPQWGNVGGANVSDGACFWKLRWSHWSKDIATQAQAKAGTDNTTAMTPLRVAQEVDSKRPLKTFTALSQLGLGYNAGIGDIATAMPDDSSLYFSATASAYPNLGLPSDGIIEVQKNTLSSGIRFLLSHSNNNGANLWMGRYASWMTNPFSGWRKLATNGALSMPSSSCIQIGTGTREYVAPTDGWLYLDVISEEGVDTYIGSYDSALWQQVKGNVYIYTTIFPLSKGQKAIIGVTKGNVNNIRFAYAQSEV